jgi:transketolase
MEQLLDAFAEAKRTTGVPTVILARTVKGKGVSFIEGRDNWHGKAIKPGEELDRAIAELEAQFVPESADVHVDIAAPVGTAREEARSAIPAPTHKLGDQVATREAFGTAIARLGSADPRVVALDADVKNSTFSDKFEAQHPDRFYQSFIAEQAMVGAAMGLASRGAIPFAATFAAFFTRAADFIRMAAISGLNIKLAGSHCGVSIGEDGASQMALEDIATMAAQPNFCVLYPCDAVSAERLTIAAAEHEGPVYIRTSRPKTPVIYDAQQSFPIGGCKVLRQSSDDVATVIGAGVTVFEALKAYEELHSQGTAIRVIDLYSVQPIDRATLLAAARATQRLITVEDHYVVGGIGDAVSRAVAEAGVAVMRLAVPEIPRSGKPEELIDHYGLSARHIVAAVRHHAGLSQ